MFGIPSHRTRLRTRRLVLIILCAIAAAAVVFLFVSGRFPALVFGNGSVRSIHSTLPTNIQAAGDDGFLYSEGSKIYLISRGGTETWSLETDMDDIRTSVSEQLILAYSEANLQVMRFSREQLFATSVDSEILGGAAGEEYVAILIDAPPTDSTVEQTIYIFDQSGQKSTQLSIDCQVTDFGFFSDGDQKDVLWVASLNTSGSAPVSRVTLYNKTNGDILSSLALPDRVAQRVAVTSKLIFVSGSGVLTAHSYAGEQEYELPIYGFDPAAFAAQPLRFCAAFEPRSSAHIETALVFEATESDSAASFADSRFPVPMNVIALAISANQAFAFTGDTMYVYSLDGSLQRTQNLGASIMSVKQVSNDYVILWGEEGNTYILQLR